MARKENPTPAQRLPFEVIQKGKPVIGTVFSPSGGVGKSSMAMNLAAYIALEAERQAEEERKKRGTEVATPRVLVVDGDIVHGSLALRLAGRLSPSLQTLTDYIEQRHEEGFRDSQAWPPAFNNAEPPAQPLRDFVMWHDSLPNLNLLAAPETPNAFWGFRPAQYREILTMLARFYRVIIIDSGTEIVMNSQRSWLAFASHIFLLTAPDIDRIHNASKAADIITHPQPDPRDPSRMSDALVKDSNMSLVMTRYDADTGIDPDKAIADYFPGFAKKDIFRVPDLAKPMSRANNKGRFLVTENPEFHAVVASIASRLFEGYREQNP
jgi:MinD-like ATPase involved in chromosome partitioning or flagellar assembly